MEPGAATCRPVYRIGILEFYDRFAVASAGCSMSILARSWAMPTRPLNPSPKPASFAAAVTRFPILQVVIQKTRVSRSSSAAAGLMLFSARVVSLPV